MARIRIDDDAEEKLEKASNKVGGTKSGLASEFIRNGAEEILED